MGRLLSESDHDTGAGRTNLSAKAAKLYVTDSGPAAHLLDVDAQALREPGHPALGGLVETFVYTGTVAAARHEQTCR